MNWGLEVGDLICVRNVFVSRPGDSHVGVFMGLSKIDGSPLAWELSLFLDGKIYGCYVNSRDLQDNVEVIGRTKS